MHVFSRILAVHLGYMIIFLTNFCPWRPPRTPKQVITHSWCISYAQGDVSRPFDWPLIENRRKTYFLSCCRLLDSFYGVPFTKNWPKIDQTLKKIFWRVLAWSERDLKGLQQDFGYTSIYPLSLIIFCSFGVHKFFGDNFWNKCTHQFKYIQRQQFSYSISIFRP